MRNLQSYIRYMRRQPKHMQKVHAFVFAGAVTVLLAGVILYTDYGFWHEKYQRADDLMVASVVTNPTVVPESPSEMFTRFWGEARIQFSSLGTSGASMLEGKETYVR